MHRAHSSLDSGGNPLSSFTWPCEGEPFAPSRPHAVTSVRAGLHERSVRLALWRRTSTTCSPSTSATRGHGTRCSGGRAGCGSRGTRPRRGSSRDRARPAEGHIADEGGVGRAAAALRRRRWDGPLHPRCSGPAHPRRMRALETVLGDCMRGSLHSRVRRRCCARAGELFAPPCARSSLESLSPHRCRCIS